LHSKWDNIELSDDEDDVHPNIDKESWFRLKHRSRVEREENEAKDKANILAEVGGGDGDGNDDHCTCAVKEVQMKKRIARLF